MRKSSDALLIFITDYLCIRQCWENARRSGGVSLCVSRRDFLRFAFFFSSKKKTTKINDWFIWWKLSVKVKYVNSFLLLRMSMKVITERKWNAIDSFLYEDDEEENHQVFLSSGSFVFLLIFFSQRQRCKWIFSFQLNFLFFAHVKLEPKSSVTSE